MKRTTLMTILAMSLALGASRADMPADTKKADEHHRLAEWIPVGGEGVIAAKDPAEQQQPVGLNLPGQAKPPLLMAIGPCGHCINNSPFSTWQQVRMALSLLYWI